MRILIAGIPGFTDNYETALERLGIHPMTSLYGTDVSEYDSLLLPGGGDLDPAFFGEENRGSVHIDPDLDQAQLAILDAFFRRGKPILGICRGMQLLNVYLGGSLCQHLPTASVHAWDGADRIHAVRCLPGSLLHQLYGPSCMVNSAHHQGLEKIGSNLKVTQRSPDGVPEAVEHTKKPILGVQWHPERTGCSPHRQRLADGELLIRYFLTLL